MRDAIFIRKMRLTLKQFQTYYAKTDPGEPKPVREIHAIRMADSDFIKNYGWEAWQKKISKSADEFLKKYKRQIKIAPTLG